MKRFTLLFVAILSTTLLVTGCSTTPPLSAEMATAPIKINVPQDPMLRITTLQVMDLFAKEFGKAPLVAKTLNKNKSFQLVDARPIMKYEGGHVPGAINIPKVLLAMNLDKLAKDKTIIFYCGGLHCGLSSASAKIAIKNGFKDVKVWYEGQPGWVKSGNYAEMETKGLEKLILKPSKKAYVLIDARPNIKYQKTFIPTAISLPKAEFGLKKGLLPNDKNIPLIFYCGGYKCELSHLSAKLALEMGYKKVSVYAAGQPAWKKAKLPFWGNKAGGVKKQKVASAALPEVISAKEFKNLVSVGNATIVDVRSEDDYATAHIPGSIYVMDEDFLYKPIESIGKLPKKGRVILHCTSGGRAGAAYYAILDTKYENKKNVQYLDADITVNPDGTFSIGEEH